jgi:hypothetical protein
MPIARKKFKPEIHLLERKRTSQGWFLDTNEKKHEWKTVMERMRISREGIPFSVLEVIGKGLELPIKEVLILFSIPQTTYNKKEAKKHFLEEMKAKLFYGL